MGLARRQYGHIKTALLSFLYSSRDWGHQHPDSSYESACSCVLLSGGCSAAEGGVSINLLAGTFDCCVCEPAFDGKRRRGSGQGFQPSRRRIFRTAFSLRPSRPAIHRLLIPLALRRRIVLSRSWFLLCPAELPEGRPSGRASALSPPAWRRS
jgi:hypothetical protein